MLYLDATPRTLSFFLLPHNELLFSGLAMLVFALISHYKKRDGFFLVFIFLCALAVRLFMAIQDPYMYVWDERFHMMVARNMMDDPLRPVLQKVPMIHYSIWQWTLHHIWLHKQPLFMWQMAVSMKIFGVSVFSARIPSAVMGAFMVPMLYRIGIIVSGNRKTALIAAILFCFSQYQLELITGLYNLDHNDVAFGFYVLASIWAYAEYTVTRKTMYIVLIGLFSGGAILNKWLTGLLVYAGWGLNTLGEIKGGGWKKEVPKLLTALGITVAVFLPWQLYIHSTWPELAKFEMDFNAAHISHAIEGHVGTIFYYVDLLPKYFGEVGWMLAPAGFIILFSQIRKYRVASRKAAIAVLCTFAVVFLFFSYVVMTKMPSFVYVAGPMGVLFMAIACVEIERQLQLEGWARVAKIVLPILVVLMTVSILYPEDLHYNHDPENEDRKNKIANVAIYRQLKNLIPPDVKVVINIKNEDDLTAMFYNSDIKVFNGIPEQYILDSFSATKTPVAAFEPRPGYELPDSIIGKPVTFIIKKQLK